MTVQVGLCQTWSEIPKIGFLVPWSIWYLCFTDNVLFILFIFISNLFPFAILKAHYADQTNMSRLMRKPTICICKNKDAHSILINFLAYRVFTHPFFIQLHIWNFNWVSSILLRTLIFNQLGKMENNLVKMMFEVYFPYFLLLSLLHSIK